MSNFNKRKGNSMFQDQEGAGITDPSESLKPKGTPEDLPENYSPPDSLGLPKGVKERFEVEGFGLCWIRVYIDNGQLDVNNIRKSESEGYVFVRKEEIPEMSKSIDGYFSEEIHKHKDIITVGDLSLAKIDIRRRDSRTKYYDDLNKSRSKAIIEDLRQHSIGDPRRGDTFKSSWSKQRPVEFES